MRASVKWGKYLPSSVTENLPYCDTYKNEFAEAVKKGKRSPFSPAGTTHAYMINEIPKLVAGIYNKPLGVDDYHETQARLKRLSDEDLGIPKERKAKLDEMVENLSSAELAGVVGRLDTAISELRVSGLTQEQTSVVLTDVFFRYANECERANNAANSACDRYYKEFAPQMSQKDGHRDYLKYARTVIPAKVILAYTSDISKDKAKIESGKREFGSGRSGVSQAGRDEFGRAGGANSGALDAGRNGVNYDENGISWIEVIEILGKLAPVAQAVLNFM